MSHAKSPAPVKTGVPSTKGDSTPQVFVAGIIVLLVVAIFVFLGN